MSITAILNFYKRPHVIHEQIKAVREQTVSPVQIIIRRNFTEGYEFPEDIRNDKSIIIMDCSRNLGVWARFAAGLLANTEYVCVFDDDTIPCKKWFENCLHTINIVNGLLGTIGLVFRKNPQNYFDWHPHIGWDSNNDTIQEVDIVGHAWFFRRKWLFKIVPDYDKLFVSGEDMGFSWALQQIGIKTYVPPHPLYDVEMHGSRPDLAMRYGEEDVGISMNNPNWDSMFHFYKNKGFKFMKNIDFNIDENFITFIIPSIGRETLSRTIKSLENQTISNWKAIIVFDGVKSTISNTDDRITVMEISKTGVNGNNAGNVRNVALKQAHTKWVGFVDDDDTLSEDYVECLFKNTNIFKDVNTFIFRMYCPNGVILPQFESDNFYINNVGISFAVKTEFYKNKNLYFIPSSQEDFYYLDTIRKLNEPIIILENIGYYVQCNPFKIDKNFNNIFINYSGQCY